MEAPSIGAVCEVLSGRYRSGHPLDAELSVRVSRTARRLTARWKGPVLHLSMPPGIAGATVANFLTRNIKAITARRPAPRFRIGMVVDCTEIDISIVESSRLGDERMELWRAGEAVRGKETNYIIGLGAEAAANIADRDVQTAINRMMLSCARHAAPAWILPLARQCAARTGVSPRRWTFKDSVRNLGSCSGTGEIALSPRLIFLPVELREYIICHELAHLSEMNHSAAFHSVCDGYLGGREAELRRKLRAFSFPVF